MGSVRDTLKFKQTYRRRLPHIQPPGATFFMTFRLADSIPRKVWKELRQRWEIIQAESMEALDDEQSLVLERERAWFREFEEQLDNARYGPLWLKDDRLAALVAKQLHHFHGDRYRLDAYCVMANHVHVVLLPLPTTEAGKEACLNHRLVEDRDRRLGYLTESLPGQRQFVPVTFYALASLMHSIKRQTARDANQMLGRSGAFWQEEYYDHYSRSEAEWLRTIRYVLNNPVKAGLVKEWQQWPWSWHREDPLLVNL